MALHGTYVKVDHVTRYHLARTMPSKMKPTQLYMILSAVGTERGAPFALFFDPFAARAAFAAITDLTGAFTGSYTAFLVVYDVAPNGQLTEVEELGRK